MSIGMMPSLEEHAVARERYLKASARLAKHIVKLSGKDTKNEVSLCLELIYLCLAGDDLAWLETLDKELLNE